MTENTTNYQVKYVVMELLEIVKWHLRKHEQATDYVNHGSEGSDQIQELIEFLKHPEPKISTYWMDG